jgi:ABC-type cobalamin/Fe3+-siderophores transport system ATPase subunit
MFLSSTAPYKSINPIQPAVELPDFIVISGLNGSGKTQLIEGISRGVINLSGESGAALKQLSFFGNQELSPNTSAPYAVQQYRQRVNILAATLTLYKRTPEVIREKLKRGEEIYQGRGGPGLDQKVILLLEKVAQVAGKVVDDLTDDDLFIHLPLEHAGDSRNFYQQNFSAVFKQYHWKHDQNEYRRYRHQKFGDSKFLTEEEFRRVYGEPPWLLVNQIIKEARLDYHTNSPERDHPESSYEFRLINNFNGAEINFDDLSSGEKVIMSLALSLYNSNHDVEFPQVLLFDEPDAHLHPSMTKQFLDVIQNIFVNKKGVKVIMTTHSPSTVALAPDEALFVMNKTEPRLMRATKDGTLGILTSGVPSLSINYENRRQVFVESKHDAELYGKLYERLRDRLQPEISIHFISSGSGGSGSAEQVEEVVNKLAGYGNRSVYGIVDWDNKNWGNKYVKVPGGGKRYSLENYIFDPVILAAFLVRETFISRASIGLNRDERYTDISKFDDAKLQAAADFILDELRGRFENPTDTDLQEVEYVGGRKINLPPWFLRTEGHHLEDVIKEIFLPLKRYDGEIKLKREVVNKVLEDMPELIPKDIFTLFEDLQKS